VSDSGGYVPLDGKPWRLAMGLRPLREQWIEVDRHHAAELRLKAELLAARPEAVFAALPGSEEASQEVLEMIQAFLHRHHPELPAEPPPGLHPLDAAGRLVQEDLCLMAQVGAGWRLADKIGQDLSGIHGPVPGYEQQLARPTAGFFDRLRPERPVWRLNWTLIDDPALHQPHEAAPARRGDDPGRALWFRVERQTLRRLDHHPAVLFTIRTYVTPLGELVDTYPEAAGALRSTLPTVPPETVSYKGWDGLVGDVTAWLEARTA
jgi:dimethylamine monooxygenase subunit A